MDPRTSSTGPWSTCGNPFDKSSRVHAIVVAPSALYAGALRNAIRRSVDGGRTWTEIPTPCDQGRAPSPGAGSDVRIEKLAWWNNGLIARQSGGVFFTKADPVSWEQWDSEVRDFAVDPSTGQAYGVTADGCVSELRPGFSQAPLCTTAVPSPVVDMSALHGRVYLLDAQNGIYRAEPGRLEFTYPLTTEPASLPPLVRSAGSRLWGCSRNHIYTSDDGGRTWTRAAVLHLALSGFAAVSDDEVLLWDGHGNNLLYRLGDTEPDPVTTLQGFDVIDVVRGEHLWVAYGGMQHETARRITFSRTFVAGQFLGTLREGFVAVSTDRGRNWEPVDRWNDHGVAAAFLTPSGDIFVHSYLGAVRKLTHTHAGYRAETLIDVQKPDDDQVPYVERTDALYFRDDDRGFITGWWHHLGLFCYSTTNGGRTWKQVDYEEFPYARTLSWGDRVIAVSENEVCLLRGDDRRVLLRVESDPATHISPIDDVSADSRDLLLIRLKGELRQIRRADLDR